MNGYIEIRRNVHEPGTWHKDVPSMLYSVTLHFRHLALVASVLSRLHFVTAHAFGMGAVIVAPRDDQSGMSSYFNALGFE